jgi:hypothetical protein
MKTTIEIPDSVFRKAKASAAEQGIPLRRFVTNAVERELESRSKRTLEENRKALRELAGGLSHLKDHKRIRAIIEEEFEKIEPEMWA